MCNIAGYVGTKQAAPILLEMFRKEEGWNSGYYTGIATIHDGKLHMQKVIGDLEVLLQEKNPGGLPGTVGIIHGRSMGGGSVEWGHPFMDKQERIAYIANGTAGIFREKFKEAQHKAYGELLASGYQMRSREETPVGNYTVMPDGACVHGSDLMCQQIAQYVDDGATTAEAGAKAYRTLTGEVVGLLLNRDEPDRITWGRINFPMFAGFASHGVYLASTPQAFPEDAENVTLLNAGACGAVYRDRLEIRPMTQFHTPIVSVTPGLFKTCYEAVCDALSKQAMTCEELDEVLLDIFGRDACAPYPAVEYMIMDQLEKEGRLEVTVERVPGALPHLTAPQFRMKLK